MALPFKRQEAKEWAREHFKGACNVTLPSFTPDFKSLNEKGIRHDIHKAAADGFWGTLIVSECSTTLAEYKQFIDIAVDERPKGFYLVAHGSFDTMEETIEIMKYAADRGVEANLLSYAPSFWPKNADDVYHIRHKLPTKRIWRSSFSGCRIGDTNVWTPVPFLMKRLRKSSIWKRRLL